MPAQTEEILFRVNIEANQATLVELQKKLNDNKNAVAALNKAFKENRISADELAVGQSRLKQEASNLTQSQGVLNKAIAAQKAIDEAAAGSVDQLAAKAKLLTAQYNALGVEQKKTAAGKALTAELKATNEALKEAGEKVGDFRRGVGGYKDAIVSAAKESGLFGGIIGKATGAQEKYAAAQKFTTFVVGESTGAMKLLKLAFIALPIFAIVAALGVLYTAFTSTQAGMDFIGQKTAALGAVMRVLTNVVVGLGQKLTAAAQDPKQAFSDLFDFLKNNIANRFAALGVLIDAIRSKDLGKLTDGVIQLGVGITDGTAKLKGFGRQLGDAAASAQQLEAASQAIARAERELNVRRDESRAKIEGLKKLSDDAARSVAVRAAAAKEAAQIENSLLAEQLKLQDERLANLQAAQRLKKNLTNDDLDQLAALRSERAKTAQESLTLQTELQNKINALAAEGAAKAQKLREDAVKARIAAIESELIGVKEGSEKELALREKLLEEQAKLEGLAADKTANDRKLITVKLIQDLLKLEEDFDKTRQERAKAFLENQDRGNAAAFTAEQKRKDDSTKELDESYKRNESLLERSLAKQAQSIEENYANGILSKEQYESRLELLEENGIGARVILQKQFNKDSTQLETQLAKIQGARRRKTTDEERATYQDRVKAAAAFGEQVGALFADTLTGTGKSLQEFAGKVLILILDSLERVIIAQQTEALVKGLAKGPAGLIEAGLEIAAITVAFETAKAVITSGTAAPFNKGGIVGGSLSPNSPNEDSELTYLTKGEMVLTKNVASLHPELPMYLGHLNALAGGTNFAPGFTPARAPQQIDGGLMARSIGQNFPSAAEIGREVGKNVPKSISVTAIDEAKAKHERPRKLTSLR